MSNLTLKSVFSEKNLFILFSIANIIPVCLTSFIGSLDGPQHLYVSNIIVQLIKGNESYQQFYLMNQPIIGNVLGNYILALFNLFLPAWLAEKIFIITYLVSLTYGFRYLVISIKGSSGYLTLLIFPFSYHLLFMMGYYNFSLSIAIMFISLGFWIRHHKKFTLKSTLISFFLFTLTYYTHVFVFAFLLLIIGFHTTYNFVVDMSNKEKQAFKKYVTRAGIALACAIPGLIFSYLYLSRIPEIDPSGAATNEFAHWKNLFDLKILIGFVDYEEVLYTRILFITLLTLCLWIIAKRFLFIIKQYRAGTRHSGNFFELDDFWMGIAFVFLGLYIYFPNNMSFSFRITVLLLYIIILWIAVQDFNPKHAILPIAVILYCGISLRTVYVKYQRPLDRQITEIQSIERLIPENTLIMTANYSDNWILYHVQNYIGTEKPIIDIRSPAVSELFAVNWNHKKRPFTFVGAKESGIFSGLWNNPENSPVMIAQYVAVIDYVQFLRFSDEDNVKKILARDYQVLYVSKSRFVALFKFNAGEKVRAYQTWLENKPNSVKLLKEKAAKSNIPYETFLQKDALWLYDQSFAE
ncbi:MAG: hypothetical protein AB9834_15335 [Lentimicrobium sp.]